MYRTTPLSWRELAEALQRTAKGQTNITTEQANKKSSAQAHSLGLSFSSGQFLKSGSC